MSIPTSSPGSVLGNYVLLEPIGRGGMGQVFKAEHRRLKRRVAVKTLPADVLISPEAVARFQREVEVAGRLEHPNIVAAYDANEADGVHFLVMQYVDGIDLATLVREHGPLSPNDAVHCIQEAAKGLAHAHEKGIVHQDIKPSNLMLGRDGMLRILDMGLAWILPTPGTGGGGEWGLPPFMGTADFLAPERIYAPGQVDPRSDLYGLGCTLYYLLAGRPPFQGRTLDEKIRAHRERPIPSLTELGRGVPTTMDRLLARLVAKDPADRFQTAEELLDAVERTGIEYDPGFRSLRRRVFLEKPDKAVAAALGIGGAAGLGERPVGNGLGRVPDDESTNPLAAAENPWQNVGSRPGRRLLTIGLAVAATVCVAIAGAILLNSPSMPLARSIRAFTDDPQQQTANWVLSIGGTLQVQAQNYTRTVNTAIELPSERLRITTVQLGGNKQVNDASLRDLAGLTTLEMLWLGNTAVGDEGLAHLAGLTHLRHLGLSRTRVTDEGLAHLQGLSRLLSLRLAGTDISDAGMRHLAALQALESLDVSHTRISDLGLKELQHLPNLRELVLENTRVTAESIRALQVIRPTMTVRR